MAWQYETGAGTDRATGYRDLLVKIVAMATSKHVATVAFNAAGSGYVTGDIIALTHAGAYLDARFEVTAVAGAITALRIVASGAFSNRIASAVAVAAGTGYAVGDILQLAGGTAREKGKVQVATLVPATSTVATVTVFETGGAYTSAPGAADTTTKIGPTAGSGSGATITATMTGLIGSTALATTAVTGVGTGGTVDITLAESGWTAERNVNNLTFNALTDEKHVVLKGDASGRTNKPYIGFCSITATSGLNTRYALSLHGMIAHNAGTAMSAQPGILGDPGTHSTGLPYLLCDENDLQDMDFWISVDDMRISGVLDTNSAGATSDNNQYHHWYAGFLDSFATETEDPYPMFVGAAAREYNINPSLSSGDITGLSEAFRDDNTNTGLWFYLTETSDWVMLANTSTSSANTARGSCIFPMAQVPDKGVNYRSDDIVDDGPVVFWTGVGSTARAVSSRRIVPIPGSSTHLHYPIPLTVLHRASGGSPIGGDTNTNDKVVGNLANWFWVYNTDSSAATIALFSEDYITIGSDRYRVFHTHVQTENYHYVCVKETV
jgi:hypothetical protein